MEKKNKINIIFSFTIHWTWLIFGTKVFQGSVACEKIKIAKKIF